MPRLPILRRTLLYQKLPRNGGIRLLDFNLVATSLGTMIESRSINRAAGSAANEDVFDNSFTDMQPADDATFGQIQGLNSLQWPVGSWNPAFYD